MILSGGECLFTVLGVGWLVLMAFFFCLDNSSVVSARICWRIIWRIRGLLKVCFWFLVACNVVLIILFYLVLVGKKNLEVRPTAVNKVCDQLAVFHSSVMLTVR